MVLFVSICVVKCRHGSIYEYMCSCVCMVLFVSICVGMCRHGYISEYMCRYV